MRALAREKINYFVPEYNNTTTDMSRDTDENSGSDAVIEFNYRTPSLSHANPRDCSVINTKLKATEMILNCLNKSKLKQYSL